MLDDETIKAVLPAAKNVQSDMEKST